MPLGVTPITYSKGGLGVLSRVDGVAFRFKKKSSQRVDLLRGVGCCWCMLGCGQVLD